MVDWVDKPEPKQDDCYVSPATIYNLLIRAPEIITDPSSNQLSASRMVLLLCGCCTVALTWAAIVYGQIDKVTTLVTAVAGVAAGVYFASTVKDFRWRREDREGPQ